MEKVTVLAKRGKPMVRAFCRMLLTAREINPDELSINRHAVAALTEVLVRDNMREIIAYQNSQKSRTAG